MIEITNSRTSYDIRNSDGTLTLEGTIVYVGDLLTEARFGISDKDGKYVNFRSDSGSVGHKSESLEGEESILESARKFAHDTITEFTSKKK